MSLSHSELKKVLNENTAAPPGAPLSNGGGGGVGVSPLMALKRSKSRDAAKKMGGGSKGMWKTTDVLTAPKVDSGDPNFDSEDEESNEVIFVPNEAATKTSVYRDADYDFGPTPKFNLQDAKKQIIEILKEFFVSGETDEVRQSLVELESQVFHYEFVKRAISMSLDKHEKEREMVSRLLSSLYPKTLTSCQIGKGFERILEFIDDLQLDAPDARVDVATFLARAVVDEILPPSFLMDPLVVQIGDDIVDQAKKKLCINHGIARLEKGWGPGDGRPVEELKVAIDQLFQEFILSGDRGEAVRCVHELNVEHFHHEVIKRAITNAMDLSADKRRSMSELFVLLTKEQIVSEGQLKRGFGRVYKALDDLKLDIPSASSIFDEFVNQAINDGILPNTFVASLAN